MILVSMEAMSEHELVSQCKRGSAPAWDELFQRHYAATMRFIFQMVPSFTQEDAEEICQEAFLTVIRNLATFEGKSQLQTWIFKIAANKSRDFHDKQTAQKRGGGMMPLSLNAEDPETGLTIDPPSGRRSPDSELLSMESMQLVRAALDGLGDPCREVIELRYFADLSYEEIAASLALNVKTVSSRLSKCLDRLENIMTQSIREENSPNLSV